MKQSLEEAITWLTVPALGWKRGRLAAAWKWVERELVDEAEGEGEAAGAHRRISPITAARVQPLRYFLFNYRPLHVLAPRFHRPSIFVAGSKQNG